MLSEPVQVSELSSFVILFVELLRTTRLNKPMLLKLLKNLRLSIIKCCDRKGWKGWLGLKGDKKGLKGHKREFWPGCF